MTPVPAVEARFSDEKPAGGALVVPETPLLFLYVVTVHPVGGVTPSPSFSKSPFRGDESADLRRFCLRFSRVHHSTAS